MLASPKVTASLLPLCVDLDGTLVTTDTLIESFLKLFKKQPTIAAPALGWLMHGKAHLKTQIDQRSSIAVADLPYHQAVLHYLREEKDRGRKIILVTASPQRLAEQVAQHAGVFTEVIATKQTNNSGKNKAAKLIERFGVRGYAYVGNSLVDLPVWAAAASGSIVSSNKRLIARAGAVTTIEHVFAGSVPSGPVWLAALRSKQWIKNLLIFVPLIAAHRVTDLNLVVSVIIAFGAFAAAASSVYLTNDLLDLEADRHHPTKKTRPLAAGKIPLLAAISTVPILLLISGGLAWMLPSRFMVLLIIYLGLTVAYSLRLKRVVLIDVFILSVLYTIRIFAGAAAIMVPVSSWLTAFALFFFLSLAMVKRFAELRRLKKSERKHAQGRGYVTNDAPLLSQFGVTSGVISAVILALYISSPEINSLYRGPELLWLLIPLLLFWIGRVWFLAHRGNLDEDPTMFAVKDGPSYLMAVAVLLIVFAATKISV